MPIQYPIGGAIRNTLTAGATTPTLLVDFIRDELVAAGWTVVSGASGNWLLQSLAFNGNQGRVRLVNTGPNCANVFVRRINDTQESTTPAFILPGGSWRIIAYPMQFCAFIPGPHSARDFVFVSVLHTDSVVLGSPNPSLIMMGSGSSDTDAVVRQSWRNRLSTNVSGQQFGVQYVNYNGIFYTAINGSGGAGSLQIITARGNGNNNPLLSQGGRWKDGSYNVLEPLVAWGTSLITEIGDIGGQLWGAFTTIEQRILDTSLAFAGHNFFTVGVEQAASSAELPQGSLMLAVD